jgi:hypothetical protein
MEKTLINVPDYYASEGIEVVIKSVDMKFGTLEYHAMCDSVGDALFYMIANRLPHWVYNRIVHNIEQYEGKTFKNGGEMKTDEVVERCAEAWAHLQSPE